MSLFAHVYDLVMAPGERGRIGRLRRAVVSSAGGRVIEVGAGTGLNFPHYGEGAWVVAIDPDRAMLDRARIRARDAEGEILLVAADAELLPFRDGAFDEAVVGLAMCTIPHPMRALDELRRVVAPGGFLRMLEHVRVDRPALVGRVQDWLTPVWRRVAGGCHLNRRTVELVADSGFELTATSSHFGGSVRTMVARAPGPATPREPTISY